MEWGRRQYCLCAARHGTLARAGAAVHVDATTVSRRVSALETSLGQTLFERAPTGFVLTAAGRALVPHAEAMAAAAARIHKADEAGSGLSGQLRVSVSEGFRSEEHTSELQSLMRISYAVFCLKKKITHQ